MFRVALAKEKHNGRRYVFLATRSRKNGVVQYVAVIIAETKHLASLSFLMVIEMLSGGELYSRIEKFGALGEQNSKEVSSTDRNHS